MSAEQQAMRCLNVLLPSLVSSCYVVGGVLPFRGFTQHGLPAGAVFCLANAFTDQPHAPGHFGGAECRRSTCGCRRAARPGFSCMHVLRVHMDIQVCVFVMSRYIYVYTHVYVKDVLVRVYVYTHEHVVDIHVYVYVLRMCAYYVHA